MKRIGQRQREYWRRNVGLTLVLLMIWLLVTFVAPFYARELNAMSFLGFPLGFYMAAQGAVLVDIAIIGVYAWRMNRLDESYGQGRDD
jgi:putative solute:sodium symporter small subunit